MSWFGQNKQDDEENIPQSVIVTTEEIVVQDVQMDSDDHYSSNSASSSRRFTPTSAFGSVTTTGGATIQPTRTSRFPSPPLAPSAFGDQPIDQDDVVDYDDDTLHVSSDVPLALQPESESVDGDLAELDGDVDMDGEPVTHDIADTIENLGDDAEMRVESDIAYFGGNVAVRKKRKRLSVTEEIVPLNQTSDNEDSAVERPSRQLTPAPVKRRGQPPKTTVGAGSELHSKHISSRTKKPETMPAKSSNRHRKPRVKSVEDEEFEVEHIVTSKYNGNRKLFLVKWKGFSSEENTWEPRSHLQHARLLIEEFEKNQKQDATAASTKNPALPPVRSSSRVRAAAAAAPAKAAKLEENTVVPKKRGPGRPPASGTRKKVAPGKRSPGRSPASATSSTTAPRKRGPGRPPASATSKKTKLDAKDSGPSSDDEWEIEAVLASEGIGRGTRYLVKWKGFSESENTWEPMANIFHCRAALDAFKNRKKA